MSPNYAAQRDALNSLYLAYTSARDFTLPVLRRAFGDPPPPPSKCVWPPPGSTEAEARSRLQSVQYWLRQSMHELPSVIRDIKAAQVCLVASGFDVPRSYIIANPLGNLEFPGCSVTEIVKSVPADDAALEKVLGEIKVDLVYLEGRLAAPTPPAVNAPQGEEDGGDLQSLAETIPAFDESSTDWVLSKNAAGLLGLKTRTLANRRSAGPKGGTKADAFGVHDLWCFWRKRGNAHPYYYLPLMKEHAGHLAKTFPRNTFLSRKNRH